MFNIQLIVVVGFWVGGGGGDGVCGFGVCGFGVGSLFCFQFNCVIKTEHRRRIFLARFVFRKQFRHTLQYVTL
jgi:hypothetical protein